MYKMTSAKTNSKRRVTRDHGEAQMGRYSIQGDTCEIEIATEDRIYTIKGSRVELGEQLQRISEWFLGDAK